MKVLLKQLDNIARRFWCISILLGPDRPRPTHPARSSIRLLALGVVAVLLCSGCGWSNSAKDKAQNAQQDKHATDVQPVPGASPEGPGAQQQGQNPELLIELLERMGSRTADFAVKYEFSGAADQGFGPGVIDIAVRGSSKAPTQQKTSIVPNDKVRALAFYGDQSGTAACAALTADSWRCFKTSASMTSSPIAFSIQDLYKIVDSYRSAQKHFVFSRSETNIAGRHATCITAQATPGLPPKLKERVGDSAKFCISDQGVLLALEVNGNKSPMSLTASQYATKATEADFQPPAAVQAGLPNFAIPSVP